MWFNVLVITVAVQVKVNLCINLQYIYIDIYI